WVSLIVLVPLVTYCAWPFYQAAWRGIKHRTLNMDVSVSAAIIGAFLASTYATLTGTGDVYFETVSMFIFFLTTSRFLEMRARHRAGSTALALQKMAPRLAVRLTANGEQEKVSIRDLKKGDRLLVKAGEVIPLDGIVIEGNTSVSEAVVTGEPLPVRKSLNDIVISGAMNVDQPIVIGVTKEAAESSLSLIAHLIERAAGEKNQIAIRADALANYSVGALLLIAFVVFVVWCFIDPTKAFWIVLSMLVATCPCALSIATPAAITASTNQLAKTGFLLTRGHLLDTLPKVTHAIFDKTGTLTFGKIQIDKIQLMGSWSERDCLALADSIERFSEHPIAHAFR
ncbi:MAG TPA: HAD-IC family P-type ATPase, partial [Pseudomonadales bacterium]|nr:HAD-IC family P-type ATPase [Pseudomonadales bacterium]